MKAKDERERLEELLANSNDQINSDVPLPGNIPEELQAQPTMGIDFAELRVDCVKEARIMVNNAIIFILTPEEVKNNDYVKDKLEVDVMSLSGMIYQVRVNEAMQKAMMEEVDRGFMNPRMFEVFGQLSKTIGELNKQLLGTVEAIKSTYKDVKLDIREKQTDALGAGQQSTNGMITQGDGGVITMGTKEMIKSIQKHKKNKNSDIQDANIVDDSSSQQ